MKARHKYHGRNVGKTMLFTASFLMAIASAEAQFALDWISIDGGGVAGAGGSLTVSGTIGQPDVGYAGGGAFTVEGGFLAIETISLPKLTIQKAVSNVTVTWPAVAKYSGFVLQESASLSPQGIWTPVKTAVAVVNGFFNVTLPASLTPKFYRLQKS